MRKLGLFFQRLKLFIYFHYIHPFKGLSFKDFCIKVYQKIDFFSSKIGHRAKFQLIVPILIILCLSPLLLKATFYFLNLNSIFLSPNPADKKSKTVLKEIYELIEKREFGEADNLLLNNHEKLEVSDYLAIKGFYFLHKGEYKQAEDLLDEAKQESINSNGWLNKALAISALANNKTTKTAYLAGWPDDCQANFVSHAYCMHQIADWHGEIVKIEKSLKRCLVDSNKALYHQKRQIIFLGESLKTLLKGIEENEGLYKEQLLIKYKQDKQNLDFLLAHYERDLFLDKQKAISEQELTKEEKALKNGNYQIIQ